ncbi:MULTISPECIES: VOC family protein [Ramlibacter]|uniref:VOC family protein n=1 Tax=Ramlibacter TaxID=174951 RepID=UPI0012FA9EB7|nr:MULTISPECIES: VOC family protein [Ramlibacter]MBA2962161.1 diguanylate cyclase [Ramlibacter sp. CGMCC 1.13660]
MTIHGLHHFTLRCDAEDLEGLRAFYSQALGLEPGPRPTLRFGGYWLYAAGQPVVHLYASGRAASVEAVALDHVAFRASGLAPTRSRLAAAGIGFTEAPVPGWTLHQVFLRDPLGLKIELTFDLAEEGEQAG